MTAWLYRVSWAVDLADRAGRDELADLRHRDAVVDEWVGADGEAVVGVVAVMVTSRMCCRLSLVAITTKRPFSDRRRGACTRPQQSGPSTLAR